MSAATIITSTVSGGVNSHATVSEEANAFSTDFVTQGVVGSITATAGVAPTTGSFGLNQDGTPDMGLLVNAGQAYVTGTPTSQDSQTLRARMSANYTAYTINANTSGSTKYDWVYLKLDATKAANPASAADDVITLYTSRSTSNGSDTGTPPTYGILLGVVTVANNATSILNANISDQRTQASFNAASGFSVATIANPYKCSAYLSAAGQTLSNTSATKVHLNTEEFDTGSNFDAVTNYRFTAPIAGFYQVNAAVTSVPSSTNNVVAYLYKNGTAFRSAEVTASATANTSPHISGLIQLAANDYLELFASNSVGSGATITGGTSGSTAVPTYMSVALSSKT